MIIVTILGHQINIIVTILGHQIKIIVTDLGVNPVLKWEMIQSGRKTFTY